MSMTLFDLFEFPETRPADVLDCGHSIHALEHYETCLNLTCPLCGLTETTPYRLWAEHSPYQYGHVDICTVLMGALDKSACCTKCRSYTFGHSACTHEGCVNFEAGHGYDFFQKPPFFCQECGIPSRMIWKWGVW